MADHADAPRPEFAFIDWVRQRALSRPEVVLGIGDDAAVLSAGSSDWVTTVDVLLEGVHFDAETPPELIGRKAMAVNVSDLAAMAAEPCAAFVGMVLPRKRGRRYAEQVSQGLFDLARYWKISIAGGDTNSWDGPLVLSVTLLGKTTEHGAVRRSGAQPGDWILVTGALGGSLLSGRHLTFIPRVQEALELTRLGDVHAMLDLSDGLASDLFHILEQSQVGATLEASAIPIHADVAPSGTLDERLHHAFNDGEDFELLLTVSPEEGERLLKTWPCSAALTKIGVIEQSPGARLRFADGIRPFPRGGWTHPLDQSPNE